MYEKRQQQLTGTLRKNRLSALAINAGPSLSYLTGLHFHLMERPVVLLFTSANSPVIVLPELEQAKLTSVTYELQSFTYPENPDRWQDVFKEACAQLNLAGSIIGIEPQQLRMLEHNYLVNAVENLSFTDAADIISKLRSIKDPEEINRMKTAVDIAQSALTATLPVIGVGMSEKDIASELVIQLLKHGSDPALPFSPIVSSGPNGANPHARPSRRKLEQGDLLVVDWGATWAGYASDLTRTFAIGEVGPEEERIHGLVRQANEAALAAARPGVSCSTVDRAAREVIVSAGYGACFTHRTGHGIGMECHESPYIRDDNELILEKGMSFTIEPGIYLAGRNGVRIEDDVVITEDGAESLSTFPRNLITID